MEFLEERCMLSWEMMVFGDWAMGVLRFGMRICMESIALCAFMYGYDEVPEHR